MTEAKRQEIREQINIAILGIITRSTLPVREATDAILSIPGLAWVGPCPHWEEDCTDIPCPPYVEANLGEPCQLVIMLKKED